MSTATFTPGTPGTHRATHHIGNAARALKVFASAVFSVAVLGEYGKYAEEAGVSRSSAAHPRP
ncbi:hypothetical protein ACIHCQ_22070 [Streptomyces sp. NPDC052236]|uniref:hypothetical protein n=1 Tax=Streptomyces sp. NPDC052236 TaxID=3365686 RepID=UPI0037D09D3C